MFIADSQVHIWGPNTPERPWREGREPRRPSPLGAKELLDEMDSAGVRRAVLVPPQLDADRNDLVLEAARLVPDRFAAMGRLDLQSPRATKLIRGWLEQPGMLGLRCSFTAPYWARAISGGAIEWLWQEAEKAEIPIMALVPQKMVFLIDQVAARYPGLKLAMCHLCLPTDKQDDDAFRDFDELLVLARRENVSVKASAMPSYTSDKYPFRRVHPYLRRVYDAFGPKRIFWGTDFSRLRCSYKQAVTMFTEEIDWLTSEDKEWIMGRALCEWLRWEMPRD